MEVGAIAHRLISAEDTTTPVTPFTDGSPFLHDDVAYPAQAPPAEPPPSTP